MRNYDPTIKPAWGAEFNHDHPLAADLFGYYPFLEGTGGVTPNLAGPVSPASFYGGTATWSPGQDGVAIETFRNGAHGWKIDASPSFSGALDDVTVFWKGRIGSYVDGYIERPLAYFGDYGVDWSIGIGTMWTGGSGYIIMGSVVVGGTAYRVQPTYDWRDKDLSIVVTRRKANSAVTMYINGISQGTTAAGSDVSLRTVGSTSQSIIHCVNNLDASQTQVGRCEFAGYARRWWSAEEARLLHQEPYALLKPAISRTYFLSGGGAVTVSPSAATAVATRTNPTVVLGSLVLSPTAASAAAAATAPTVVQGSLALSPTAASAATSVTAPTVVQGSVAVEPSTAAAAASVTNPTVVLGSVSVAPTAADASAETAGPTVVLGSIAISPTAASARALAVDPSVSLGGDLGVAPAAAIAKAAVVSPTVVLGSLAINPTHGSARALAADPTVALGSTTASPSAAEAGTETGATVVLGSTAASPAPAAVRTAGTDPTVVLGSLALAPTRLTARALATDPTVILGSLTLTPSPCAAACSTSVTVSSAVRLPRTGLVALEAEHDLRVMNVAHNLQVLESENGLGVLR